MLDQSRLLEFIAEYKRRFAAEIWPEEKYKWLAVQHFQDNWDPGSPDFAAMLARALAKTSNLLSSSYYFPRRMVNELAKAAPLRVAAMFEALFDEGSPWIPRVMRFQAEASALLSEIDDAPANHYQDVRAVSTYLWLRYPDKYYAFKYGVDKAAAEALGADVQFKQASYEPNLAAHQLLLDEVCHQMQMDPELAQLLQGRLTPDCYPDPQLKTLAMDFCFFLSQPIGPKTEADLGDWFPSLEEYDPGLSVEDWTALLRDPEVFTESARHIVTRMQDYGGAATCKQLAERYGESWNFYNSGGQALARRIIAKTGCATRLSTDTGETALWCVPFQGREHTSSGSGIFIWRLRDPLAEALRIVRAEDELGTSAESELELEANDADLRPYSAEDFLGEVFMSPDDYHQLVRLVRAKKNVILQGAPGVGKTFAACRLAWSMMGFKDESRVELIQFHQSYSYEDFVLGYRPKKDGDGFELTPGVFHKFCARAAADPDRDYFFIVDEINRGNLSKVFGELLMLIEADYRGTELILAASGEPFCVPTNVHLIGMMNTADRSLAMIDYALRRRFSFFELGPGFDTPGFAARCQQWASVSLFALVGKVKELNVAISKDSSLGKGFQIGHSYFCQETSLTEEGLAGVVRYEILPMLEEYWFDDEAQLEFWRRALLAALEP